MANQDDAAFEQLLSQYRRPVLNFVYRLIGDAAEAEDVAQEVFVRAYRHFGEYDASRKFSTWLFALARNAAIDRLRYRARRPSESLDGAGPVADAASVSGDVLARETEQRVAAAVAELPEEQRTVVILSVYQGLSHVEIAAVMGGSEKSVESRLYRARVVLRERLGDLL